MVNAKDMALAAAKALDSKKGRDIKVLEIDKITTLADYFVICSGGFTFVNSSPCCWQYSCPSVSRSLCRSILRGSCSATISKYCSVVIPIFVHHSSI